MSEDVDALIERFAWAAFASAHPVEAYEYDPVKFWEYFKKRAPHITHDQMLSHLEDFKKELSKSDTGAPLT